MEQTYTPAQVAEWLQMAERTVKERAHSGQWPCLKLGQRTIRFTEEHYRQILAATEQQPAGRQNTRGRNKRVNNMLKAS